MTLDHVSYCDVRIDKMTAVLTFTFQKYYSRMNGNSQSPHITFNEALP